MAVFDVLDTLLNRATGRVFGEVFTISPRMVGDDVNGRSSADLLRPVRDFTAELFENFARVQKPDERGSQAALTASYLQQEAGHTTARIRIVVARGALPYAIAQGDRVLRVKTGDRFRVAEVRALADGNVAADLNIMTSPT